jgi:hypothetical protein
MGYYLRRFAFVAAVFVFVFSAHADPLPVPAPVPMSWTENTLLVGIPIFLEAVCIVLLLHRFRTPRFFIIWVLVMHIVTYPLFRVMLLEFGHLHIYRHLVYTLTFLISPRSPNIVSFYVNIALPEVLITLIEGSLIYLMCRFVSSRAVIFPTPSIRRCWVVSLAGNICSIIMSVLAFYVDYRIHAA